MALALFDLDNTLLAGDSDHTWNEFLIHEGVAGQDFRQGNDRFLEDYTQGRLDVRAYLQFAIEPLKGFTLQQLEPLRQRFLRDEVAPMVAQKAEELLAEHRARNDTLLIITSTNSFVTGPIARMLGVDALLATDFETRDDRFTGQILGTPCFREGKVTRLMEWMDLHGADLTGSHFYTDSLNDLPLLDLVDHPVAVDPDPTLGAIALERGWTTISLR